MNKNKNSDLTGFSQELRKKMTKEERRLWYDFFKNLPCTVNRQKVIGPYIADFYYADKKIVVELDGSQHYEETAAEKDRKRDHYMEERGITVLRYTNLQIARCFDAVCQDILDHMGIEMNG